MEEDQEVCEVVRGRTIGDALNTGFIWLGIVASLFVIAKCTNKSI